MAPSRPRTRRITWPARVPAHRVEGEPGPFAKIEFVEIVAGLDRQREALADDGGGFLRALQGAGVNRVDAGGGETLGRSFGLAAAALGERDAGGAPGDELALQRMLAVAEQMEDGHRVIIRLAAIDKQPDGWSIRRRCGGSRS